VEFPRSGPKASPPDLLKRFVETPFRADFRVGSTRVIVKTNDPAIPDLLRDFETPSRIRPLRLFRWKLVLDGDVRATASEPMLLRSGPVVVVSMGPACLIGVDYEKNELFAFLGSAASGDEFMASVLRVLRELTEKAPGRRTRKWKAVSRPAWIGGQDE
jgi:hypothetical protein